MNELIKHVIEYKNDSSDSNYLKIIAQLEYLILKTLNKISSPFKDDLKQELHLAIFLLIKKFEIRTNFKNEDITVNNKNFINFIKKNGIANPIITKDLLYEYNLFCNENQFLARLKLILHSVYVDFLKKHKYELSFEIIILNSTNKIEQERIDNIPDETYKPNITFDFLNILSKQEKEFLNCFFNDDQVLTEKQVADILKVSQQAINKKKQKIFKKIKTRLLTQKNQRVIN